MTHLPATSAIASATFAGLRAGVIGITTTTMTTRTRVLVAVQA